MRTHFWLAAALPAAMAKGTPIGYPRCFVDDKPTNFDQVLHFCSVEQDGTCCTGAEEAEVEARYHGVGSLLGDCADLYQQVVCGQCHAFSGQLFARLGNELGVVDGMTLKDEFCQDLVRKCEGQITFPVYEGGMSYCEKHVARGENELWSFPFTDPRRLDDDFPDLYGDKEHVTAINAEQQDQKADGSGPFLRLSKKHALDAQRGSARDGEKTK